MYGARVTLCKTRANNSKNSMSQSIGKTFVFVPLNNSSIGLTICSGIPYVLKIFNIFPQCILSKAFLKSMKTNVAFKFLSFAPSINLLRAKM